MFGRPPVMLPLFVDQGLTARLMTERDGAVTRDGVAATVRRVMAEDGEGTEFARNAKALQEVLWDTGRQQRYIDELLEHLLKAPPLRRFDPAATAQVGDLSEVLLICSSQSSSHEQTRIKSPKLEPELLYDKNSTRTRFCSWLPRTRLVGAVG